jgi:hypothetical protein
MAQEGTGNRRRAATSRGTQSSRRRNGGSPRRATTSRLTSSASRTRGNSSPASKRRGTSKRQSRRAAGSVASKAKSLKTPLIAGGAALGGLAGGLVLGARRNMPRKMLGMTMPRWGNAGSAGRNLASLAKQVAVASERVGELTTEVRHVREETAKSTRRSPVEVVLEGLTSRRVRG